MAQASSSRGMFLRCAVAAATLCVLTSCDRGASAVATSAPAAPEQAANFKISVEAPESASLGAAVRATIAIKAVSPYKINDEYPLKVELAADQSVSPTALALSKSDARTFDPAQVVFQPEFRAAKAGEAVFTGVLRFSVCTKEVCEVKKESIRWTTHFQ